MAAKSLVVIALEWANLDALLKSARTAESEKRAELVAACFPAGVVMGTNTVDLAGGYVVKAVVRPKANIDKALLKVAIAKLTALGAVGALIAGRLVKWTPEISIAEHKKLDKRQLAIVAKAVTIEQSTPSVTLVEPT